mgnify:CR=1 FL=1
MTYRPNRRKFLRDSALMAAAVPTWPSVTSGNAKGPEAADVAQNELLQGFLHPPDSARPWVYGVVMDGNLTREGVTADLEALQRVASHVALLVRSVRLESEAARLVQRRTSLAIWGAAVLAARIANEAASL